MKMFSYLTLIAVSCVVVAVAQDCPASTFPCLVDGETGFDKLDCPEKKCCWNELEGKCYAANVGKKTDSEERSLGFGPPPKKDPFGLPREAQAKVDEAVEKEQNERSLGFLPPGVCKPPKQFPLNCVITPYTKYVFQPPVNIPYCVRIPCSLDRRMQSIYDKDIGQCGRQPGCYFDKELAEFRKYNVPIMPGVPVCHYAIRSAVFHREAKKVVDMMGEWNPYFTECIVNGEFKDEIAQGPPGCALNKLLDVFGIPSKMAGWATINPRQCGLIDACWIRGRGCFYPVDISSIMVKSGQKMLFNPRAVVYGRPKCQHFIKTTPYKLLESYHKCLIAGCSVDTNILAGYNMKLFEIGNEFSPQDHWQYWELAKVGKIGAHNLNSIHWPRKPRMPIPTPPPTQKSPFSLPPGFPSFPSSVGGGIPMPSIGGGSPTYPNIGGPPQSYNCGFLARGRGGRPCPPTPSVPPFPHRPHLYCPYKTVSFPKFTPLKGSVEGCCQINECYLSRTDIRKMHSGPTKYLSQWSMFSPCTASCGGGTQYRTRVCVSVNRAKCNGILKEVRKCSQHPCGTWTSWGPWSSCTFCGVQERFRTCSSGTCSGDDSQSKRCPCGR